MSSSFYRQQAPGRAYDFIPPEPAKREPRRARADDIADAEFVVIGRERSQTFSGSTVNDNYRPRASAFAVQEPATGGGGALSSLAEAGEEFLQRSSAKTFAAFVIALSVLAFGLFGGFSGLSGSRAAVAGPPLHFTHVSVTPRDANGMRVLLINGIIDNTGNTTQILRPVRADLFVGDQLSASVVIQPPSDVLYGGQSRGFSTRVQYVGGKMPEVRLSFMP